MGSIMLARILIFRRIAQLDHKLGSNNLGFSVLHFDSCPLSEVLLTFNTSMNC